MQTDILYWYDPAAFLISVLLVIGYHLFLRRQLKRNPQYSIQARNRIARRVWAGFVMQNESRAVLAVQTLRNSTMAATFLASMAVLMMIGALNLTAQADSFSASWHTLNLGGSTDPGLWTAKVLILVLDLFIIFFSFTLSIRMYNHAGYQLTVPNTHQPERAIPEMEVVTYLHRAGAFYTVGMRGYYFSVPLVLWLFGPLFLLISAVGVVIALFYLDRAFTADTSL